MAESYTYPENYEASRSWFRDQFPDLKVRWPEADLFSEKITDPDITIDWISAPARGVLQRLLIFSTGQHGIEAYAGSVMLQMLFKEFLPQLRAEDTGLLLIHAINPWGMKHRRRVNANNVDLNRNFVQSETELDGERNPDYKLLKNFLNPAGKISLLMWSRIKFYASMLKHVLQIGAGRLSKASLMGQYYYPKGLYFGGEDIQKETALVKALYQEHMRSYEQILHIDIHSGYGPREQMSMVNSAFEEVPSSEFSRRFDYPLVVRADAAEFYSINGDMIDYQYQHMQEQFPGKPFFATCLEFGTVGESLSTSIQSLFTMILENQMFQYGSHSEGAARKIRKSFEALYAPSEPDWMEKAVQDARQAIGGILRDQGYL